MRDFLALVFAGTAGIALWTATAIVGGRAEPWDSALYWSVAYPAALALSATLGFLLPHRPWRFAAMLIGSQAFVLALSGSGLGLLPLGLTALAVLALPAMAMAGLAGRIRRALG